MANKISTIDKDRLFKQKKLILIVDLDQTILHSCTIFVSNMNYIDKNEHQNRVDKVINNYKGNYISFVHKDYFQYTFFRDYIKEFFEQLKEYFEFHIFTMGTREYIKPIINYIDPNGKLFGSRIKAREEYKLENNKFIELKSIFPIGYDLVCILDDRLDVWMNSINVIQIPPYKCKIVEKLNKEFGIKDNQHYKNILNFKEKNILKDYIIILKNIHKSFFEKNNINTINIIKNLRNLIFNQNIIIYLDKKLLNMNEELFQDLKYKIELMGGIIDNNNLTYTHIIVDNYNFDKSLINLFNSTKIIHYDWINLCFFKWKLIDQNNFLFKTCLQKEFNSRKRINNLSINEKSIKYNIYDSVEINQMADELESFLE